MRCLSFDAAFDAVVCLDGTIPERELFQRMPRCPIVAADGAAIQLFRAYGLRADVIIGDLDAFWRAPEARMLQSARLIQIPEQETNDFEKALQFCHQQGWRRLLIVGFQGREPDHTLINWSVALRHARELELCFYDSGRYGLLLWESVELALEVGEILSLVPQPVASVRTRGLVWELTDECLQWGVRESARNVVRVTPVRIELGEGVVALFCRARLPHAPRWEQCEHD